jgi:DNA-binding NarL/FixJ family response regulator
MVTAAPAESPAKIRILIVDDIPETRKNLSKMLYFEPTVQVVGAAADGLEGLKMALELTPDIVLMDIDMPEMDGLAACTQITEQKLSTNVIMMSVQGTPDTLRRSMLAGAKEFLVKPFTIEDLLATIQRVARVGSPARPETVIVSLKRDQIRLFIVSDEPETLQGMLATENNIRLLGTAGNSSAALRRIYREAPDVVLIQVDPGADGLVMSQLIALQSSLTQVILLLATPQEAEYLGRSKFSRGKTLVQPVSAEALLEAIRQAYRHGEQTGL